MNVMADKKLMRYSTSTVMGVAVHTVSERGDWVKYADAAELLEENKRLRENPVRFMVQGGPLVMSKDFDAMKARAETAEARLTAALEVLKAVEWPNHDGIARYCHKCQRYEHCGHAAGCTLDAVLNKDGECKC